MKRAYKPLAILLVLSMCLAILAGCGSGSSTSASPSASSSPEGKTELNILMEDVPDTDYVIDLLDDFEAQTGIKVNVESITYSTMHEKLVTQLTASESSYDVLVCDNYWVGEFTAAGWVEDLGPYIEASGFDTSQYVESMWNMVGQVDGTVYFIPFYNYMMSLIYRNDVFQDESLLAAYKAKYGYDLKMPCDTLDEYVQICTFVKDTYGDKMAGTVCQAQRGDPIAMEYCNYLYSCGGDFYDDSGNIIINNENAVHALELYKEAITNGSTDGSAGFALDEAFNVYSQGQAASFISYNWMLPTLDDTTQSTVAGLSSLATVPGGHSLNGGWGWAIPTNAADKDASWKFIEFIESFDSCKARAMAGGSPTRTDIFTDPDVLASHPYLTDVLAIMEQAKMIPVIADAPQLVEVLGRELSEAVAGSKTPQEALDTVAQEMEGLS